eukprot:4025652-Karenia_brevis.AAC.1
MKNALPGSAPRDVNHNNGFPAAPALTCSNQLGKGARRSMWIRILYAMNKGCPRIVIDALIDERLFLHGCPQCW